MSRFTIVNAKDETVAVFEVDGQEAARVNSLEQLKQSIATETQLTLTSFRLPNGKIHPEIALRFDAAGLTFCLDRAVRVFLYRVAKNGVPLPC